MRLGSPVDAAVVERCSQTGLLVGYIPDVPGAHSQGSTLEELRENLREVLEMLSEDALTGCERG